MLLAAYLAFLHPLLAPLQDVKYGEPKTFESEYFKKDGKELRYKITYKWCISLSHGDSEDGPNPKLVCTSTCRGKKHAKHKECDASCDDPCTEKHYLELKGSAKKQTKGLLDRFDELAKLWFGDDKKNMFPYSKLTDLAYEKYNSQVQELKPLMTYSGELDHFAKPCTSAVATGFYECRDVGVSISAEIEEKGGSTKKTGENFAFVGTIFVPDPDKKFTVFYEKCACEPSLEPSKQANGEHVSKPVPPPGAVCTTTDGHYIAPGSDTYSVDFAGCGNINELQCTVTNHTDQPFIFTLNPGTICIGPKEYQQMMIAKFNKKNIPGKTLFAALGGGWVDQPVTFRVPAVCIEMKKETPADGAKYEMRNTAPDGLAALGRVINDGAFNGPWDQAMVWIWTDNASYEDVNNRLLFPKCTPGYYLWALWNVAQSGCKPLPSLRPFISNDYLLAWDAKAGPTKWLIGTQAQLDPKGLASTLQQNFGAMADKLKSGGPVADISHVADIIAGLCESDDNALQLLGLRTLTEVVPVNLQFEMIRKGALNALPLLLRSSDANVKAKAAEVGQTYLSKIDQVSPALSGALHAMLTTN